MSHHKLIIIGSGPAGYTAALYTARAQLAPVELAGERAGGQLMWTTDIENYPGFPTGKHGQQLMADMRTQAEKFGATVVDAYATAIDVSTRPCKVWTTMPEGEYADNLLSGFDTERYAVLRKKIVALPHAYTADALILAVGANSIMIGVPGEQEYLGRGVSTCAVCDAAFYKDKVALVVGGGDSAMEDTLALTKFTKQVIVVHRRDSFKASKVMQERVLNHPKVSVRWNSAVTKINGNDGGVISATVQTGETSEDVAVNGVFVAIGHRPMSMIAQNQMQLDSHGYIVTRLSASEAGVQLAQQALANGLVAYPSMTSVAGVFAAGDAVDVRYKQAITAAGMGCMAALDAERWLEREVQ